jgi:hypothetical protein
MAVMGDPGAIAAMAAPTGAVMELNAGRRGRNIRGTISQSFVSRI